MRYEYETEDGLRFWYEPNTNKIFDVDGNDMFADTASNFSWFYPAPERTDKKINKPMSLKITLGHACNYDCSYCLQKDVGDPTERPKNMNLEVFFENVEKHLDMSALIDLQLWGGEPLLYWNDIVPIIERYDREGLTIMIISNGSALRKKHAEFFAKCKSKINYIISHDGPGQELLRGKDPLKQPLVIDTLRMLDKLDHVHYNFLCVVGKRNYDLFAIEKYFYDNMVKNGLECRSVSYTIGKSYETEELRKNSNSADEVISGEEKEKFKSLLKDYLRFHREKWNENGYNEDGSPVVLNTQKDLGYMATGIFEYDDLGSVEFAKNIVQGKNYPNVATCGADMNNVLSVDLLGNVRTCPHTDSSYVGGKITDLENARAIKMKPWKEGCIGTKCPVWKLCKGGCPLKIAKQDFLVNCGIESVWFEAIQEEGFAWLFNSPVKRISVVNRESDKYVYKPNYIEVKNV